MQIKAQGILDACHWIKQEFGIQALEQVLDGYGPGVRMRSLGFRCIRAMASASDVLRIAANCGSLQWQFRK